MTQNGQELAVIDAQVELVVRRPATVVLDEAQKAAQALMTVVGAKARKVVFNGEQYLEFEDWQTLARFYGVTVKIERTEFVAYGQIAGFSATAVALRADGFELSRAEADCLNDEEKWRSKAKYDRQIQMLDGSWVSEPIDEARYPKSAWKWHESPRRPESRRVKVADEPVPLFQLKSMAQTRAGSKVLRNVLAWVAVLAGYRPTPAEELPAEADHQSQASPAAERQPERPRPGPSTAAQTPPTQAPGPVPAASSASAPPAGAQPTVPAIAGTTTVASVAVKKGKTKDKDWTRYHVKFADGREGVTFSDTIGGAMVAAAPDGSAAGTLVNPEIAKTEKGSDLKALLEVVKPEPVHPDEPVAGPEKVLTVRKIETDHGIRWVIQTDKRQLVTDVEQHATDAVEARKNKLGIVPSFDVLAPRAVGGQPVNKLKAFVVEVPAASETETEREPGSDG